MIVLLRGAHDLCWYASIRRANTIIRPYTDTQLLADLLEFIERHNARAWFKRFNHSMTANVEYTGERT
jgi:hypothetical protein